MHRIHFSDEAALHALRQSQESGLRHFFEQYYTPIAYFANQLLHDDYLSEEVASEAFVKLWDRREQLAAQGSIKSWLYATVRNAAVDQLRKVKRLRVSKEGLETAQKAEESVLHRMIETETVQLIIQRLALLPPKCRQVFRLYYLQGKNYEEIAQELGLSPHTVRNQRVRAVRLIRESMVVIMVLYCFIL